MPGVDVIPACPPPSQLMDAEIRKMLEYTNTKAQDTTYRGNLIALKFVIFRDIPLRFFSFRYVACNHTPLIN
jgi:hypothetical protein